MKFLHRTLRGEWYAEIGQINPVGDWLENIEQSGPFPSAHSADLALKNMVNTRKMTFGWNKNDTPKWETGNSHEGTRIRFQETEVEIDPIVRELSNRFIAITQESADHWNLPHRQGKLTPNQVNRRVKDYMGGLVRKLRKQVQTDLEIEE